MRRLKKPHFDVERIVRDCAKSYSQDSLRKQFFDNATYIKEKSDEYDQYASKTEWDHIVKEYKVNGIITSEEMRSLYEDKFTKHKAERENYYDKIMSLATNGKCPICGIGHVSTLDHYLAKSIYPTYAVTPENLIPVCKDCNYNKRDYEIKSINNALLHPYYDSIDSIEWLCARIEKEGEMMVVCYYVNPSISGELYKRLKNHFDRYKLGKAYAVQASTEISENMRIWKDRFFCGRDKLISYLNECLRSREAYMKNTWNTALLRALIRNIDVFSEL